VISVGMLDFAGICVIREGNYRRNRLR
jgi:hypothetical protein